MFELLKVAILGARAGLTGLSPRHSEDRGFQLYASIQLFECGLQPVVGFGRARLVFEPGYGAFFKEVFG